MATEHSSRLKAIIRKFGERPRIAAGHGEPLQKQHWRGETEDGKKFVYCHMGFIVSWSIGDYEHKWCHWCQKSF